jgi:hypothetical protein
VQVIRGHDADHVQRFGRKHGLDVGVGGPDTRQFLPELFDPFLVGIAQHKTRDGVVLRVGSRVVAAEAESHHADVQGCHGDAPEGRALRARRC